MSLLMSVHIRDEIPIRLYSSQEAAFADREHWQRASTEAASTFIGFRLITFLDGIPDIRSYLFTEA